MPDKLSHHYNTSSMAYGDYSNRWGRSYLHKLPTYQRNRGLDKLRQSTCTSSEEYGYFWFAHNTRSREDGEEEGRQSQMKLQDGMEEDVEDQEDKQREYKEGLNQQRQENPFNSPDRLFFPEIRPRPPAVHKDIERAASKSPRKSESPRLPRKSETLRLPDIHNKQERSYSDRGQETPFSKRIRQIELIFEDGSVLTVPSYGEEYFRDVLPRHYRYYVEKGQE